MESVVISRLQRPAALQSLPLCAALGTRLAMVLSGLKGKLALFACKHLQTVLTHDLPSQQGHSLG